MIQGHGCEDTVRIYTSAAQVVIDLQNISLEIGENSVTVNAQFLLQFLKVPVSIHWRKRIIFCFSSTICSGLIYVTQEMQWTGVFQVKKQKIL